MLCPSCGNENPEGVRFCIQCGAQMPVVPVKPKETPTPIQPPTSFPSGVLPAYRPFGIVFAVVYCAFSSLTWLTISVYASIGPVIQMYSPFDRPSEVTYLEFFIALFCYLITMLYVTGTIGLWLLTRWGRNLVALLQLPEILLGVVALIAAGSYQVRETSAELAGMLVLIGLITIAFSVFIMIYLLSSKMEIWFR